MNVYDFDETIYDSDCSREFSIHLLKKYKKTWLYLPKQVIAFVQYMRGKIDKSTFKERYFSMLSAVPDVALEVERFWDKEENKILAYYKAQHQEDDVVISASPRFLVEPMCRRLGITRVIATEVDPTNGKFSTPNCYGEEKVRRLAEMPYADEPIAQFYSDSCSDTPLAKLADEAFIVTKKGLTAWKAPKQKGMQAFFTLFNHREALQLLLLGAGHLLTSGHLAKLLVKKRVPTETAFVFGSLTSGALVALFAQRQEQKNKQSKIVSQLKKLLPAIFAVQLSVVAAVTALAGWPMIALVVATIAAFPMMYAGVRLCYRQQGPSLCDERKEDIR